MYMVVGYDGQTVSVANGYTYRPFGAFYEGECVETVDNPFCFTGQWRDAEINQYYLRARMYDPAMMRFMTRDPVRGKMREPLTLHRYLYCVNDPINKHDPTGRSAQYALVNAIMAGHMTRSFALAVTSVGAAEGNWNIMTYGIGLHKTILPVMAVFAGTSAWISRTTGYDGRVPELIAKYKAGVAGNMPGGPPGPDWWNLLSKYGGPVAVVATAFALLLQDGCLEGVVDFVRHVDDKAEDRHSGQSGQTEIRPSP